MTDRENFSLVENRTAAFFGAAVSVKSILRPLLGDLNDFRGLCGPSTASFRFAPKNNAICAIAVFGNSRYIYHHKKPAPMKRLIAIFSCIFIVVACSKDGVDPESEKTQDYTSFVLQNTASFAYPDVVLGYKKEDGTHKLIAELGNIPAGESSKEIVIDDEIKNIYAFALPSPKDGNFIIIGWVFKSFDLQKNKKNVYSDPAGQVAESEELNHTDPTQYPQP
ncbi:MAG: hypothetical protein LBU80_02140 [Rikenellaceae bacterium]|nr:hypothetical protein [Rikenellaceae bacterium]